MAGGGRNSGRGRGCGGDLRELVLFFFCVGQPQLVFQRLAYALSMGMWLCGGALAVVLGRHEG